MAKGVELAVKAAIGDAPEDELDEKTKEHIAELEECVSHHLLLHFWRRSLTILPVDRKITQRDEEDCRDYDTFEREAGMASVLASMFEDCR